MVSNFMMPNQNPVIRSNPPGTKAEDFYKWSEQSLEEMDSTLAVQQYIQQMIRRDYTDTEAILKMPSGQDEGVWKYEQLRQFCLELNGLAVRLQDECKPDQCWQMTATDQWIFLCAAHKTPKECTAIDYTRHTLDGAACLLNSNKYFPSRVSIKESSVNKLGSVCRRVYRIFSHAYFHHRQIFDEAENETYLCRRFTSFVTKYDLMSHENLIVPIFAEEGVSDSSTLQRNSEKRSSMVENTTSASSSAPPQAAPMFSIIKKPSPNRSGDTKLPQFDIASIFNLPAGVGPADDEDDDDDESEAFMDFNFLKSIQQTPPTADTAGGGDENGDDDFSFSGTSCTDFGTMKPMKKDRQNTPAADAGGGGDESDCTVIADDIDKSSGGDNSFIENPLNKTAFLTLAAENQSSGDGGDEAEKNNDESDC